MWAQFPGIVIDANNSIFDPDPIIDPFNDPCNSAWQDVVDYSKEQRDLAESEEITDVEALARIAAIVATWAEENYIGRQLETFMFVRGLSELLCRRTMGWTGPRDNPNQIGGFSDPDGTFNDTGFQSQYREAGSNQVDHFVAYVQASYYAGYVPAVIYLGEQEGWDTDSADWKLGLKGCSLGLQLRLHADPPWPYNIAGTGPSGVAWWIRKNLAE